MKKIFILLLVAAFTLLAANIILAKVDRVASGWVIEGAHGIVFTCGGGEYAHTLTDGFPGSGTYDANNNYTWDITGDITGNDITFNILYTGINAGYTLNGIGTIATDGSISGTVDGNCQTFAMEAGTATFVRTAEITSPNDGEEVSGMVSFDATLDDKDGNDNVQWAVRKGTCAAGVGTVFGNVDGHNDAFDWDGAIFHAIADTSAWDDGDYCFIFNPRESAGDLAIRETREFVLADNTAPLVNISSPLDGAVVGGSIDIVGSVTDNVKLSHYNLSLYLDTTDLSDGQTHSGDRLISSDWCSGTVHLTDDIDDENLCTGWDTTPYADGDYQIRLAARDAVGNRDTSDPYNGNTSSVHVIGITIDNIPDNKDACKKGGWESFGFKNQGACVSYVESNEKAGKK